MTVPANPQNLQVDPARLPNGFFVGCTVLIVISALGSAGNVNVLRSYIHMRKKVLLHEVVKALRVAWLETHVLVKIEGNDLREIEPFFFMHAHKF